MTPQERDVLLPLLDKLKATHLPEKDGEAEQAIREAAQAQPDMLYILTQTALIQDYALHDAQARIQKLEAQLQQPQPQQTSSGGFLSGLFGGHSQAPAVQGQPQAAGASGPWGPAPQPRPQPYVQPMAASVPTGQPSFLANAARTAAGVAGGALLFEGIESLLGGRGGGFGGGGFGGGGFGGAGFGGGGFGGQPQEIVENNTVINNYDDQTVPDDQVGVQGGDQSFDDQASYDPDADVGDGGDDGSFNI